MSKREERRKGVLQSYGARAARTIVAQHDKALSPFYERLREFALEAGLMDPADDVTAPVLGNFTVDDDEDICLAPAA